MAKQKQSALKLMDCIHGLEQFAKTDAMKLIALISQAETLCTFIGNDKVDREELKRVAESCRQAVAEARRIFEGE